MRIYVSALTDLAPWFASPLLFTEKQVTDLGLAALYASSPTDQLTCSEAALWTNLSLCLYKHALTLAMANPTLSAALAALTPLQPARTRSLEFLNAAELAALQTVGARYVPPDLLKKAYHRELRIQASELMSDYARALETRIDKVKPLHGTEWKQFVRGLQEASEKVIASEGLAHSRCKGSHVCLADGEVS